MKANNCDADELKTCKAELETEKNGCDAKIEKYDNSVKCFAGKSTSDVLTECLPKP